MPTRFIAALSLMIYFDTRACLYMLLPPQQAIDAAAQAMLVAAFASRNTQRSARRPNIHI